MTCTATIADLEAQIANPAVSDFEKKKLIAYQDQQRDFLGSTQSNLNMAQQRLADLTGTQPPPPITTTSPHVTPTNRPIVPSNDIGNIFSRKMGQINQQ